jgi:hypothetical protein
MIYILGKQRELFLHIENVKKETHHILHINLVLLVIIIVLF